ncbi:MAG: alpha/beta hydrolase [Bacteroidota bacterium]
MRSLVGTNCILFFLLFLSTWSYSQNGNPIEQGSSRLKKFLAAKSEFLAYEKKHGHFLQTKNIPLHYLEWGDPTHTPLIWLHGSLSSGYELLPFVEQLLQNQYYVIGIDYYGHGQTKIPAHEVSLYHVADDVNELMQSKNIDKAIIGGWSRGGIIATAFYDAYPEKVLGVILEDGGSVSTNTHYHKMSEEQLKSRIDFIFENQLTIPKFDSESEAYYFLYDETNEKSQFELCTWLSQDSVGRWTIGDGLWELFHMASKKQFSQTILRPTQATLFAQSMSIIEPQIIYRNLKVPMLILDPVSEEDFFPYEEENRFLFESHPTLIRYKVFPDTGHNIHYERPDEFVKELIEFKKMVAKHWQKS